MHDSKELFQKARAVIPGGVNSPVRACQSVGMDPLFIAKGKGSHIFSEEGNRYIDYVLSWGPMLLGHAHPEVTDAVHRAVDNGSSFGAPCVQEIELAEAIVDAFPGMDMVRMVNSGTEATMSALRVARAHTGRNKILKFEGNYHGHVDALLASAGSGVATLSIPGTPGVPEHTVQDTIIVPYNDLEAARAVFEQQGDEIAAIILEPVAGNMGLVPPQSGFLQGLRELADSYGSVLIFDEVITGFRMDYGGAQTLFGVTPDLTCLGKIIGGGFPVGAYGGKKELMERIAPCGSVYQAGTLAGNPVAMAAGVATLRLLAKSNYTALAEQTRKLAEQMQQVLTDKGVPVSLNVLGSAFTLFFSSEAVTDFASAQKQDQDLFRAYYAQMLEQGIYIAPSGFECTFVSFAHEKADFEQTLEAVQAVKF
ncbi:glutamate-1-semialdehyde 2,1-aminomutase [Desulfohalobium retbaense]|uniref:Glutamate-1-semialdehyde 2,1-aminomutase n=1 Tax=Desulfohalobium retbaense (strain ATCC 49708 / DSM 5692 / JCM 16813 / HR100) TaxID=485915 RepID=C8X5K6_DESRD|nr:glutamate-1-semialdehyde 2,1-aminomutase [Desulfohalobium retbaense]ACV69703.1 glutamate-1-semialdehyde-2,1-aminomutase [Desulfohalobium retbaense DSM 5692]